MGGRGRESVRERGGEGGREREGKKDGEREGERETRFCQHRSNINKNTGTLVSRHFYRAGPVFQT